MHTTHIVEAGNTVNPLKALIMAHGRGGTAEDILSLAVHLNVKDYLLLAPQATGNSWYPKSFLAPVAENEPWLTSALQQLDAAVVAAKQKGVEAGNIYFAGFSQGACLTLEYTARNAQRYGGMAAFTGGLIGATINPASYTGNFNGTPVFIGTSSTDFHVPVQRVYATTNIFKNLGADVTEKVYENMGHTINQDELEQANRLVFM